LFLFLNNPVQSIVLALQCICRSNKKLQNFVIKLIRYPVGSFQTNNYSESNQCLHLRVRKQITLVQTKPKNRFPLCITAPMVQYLQT
jgi:hypothetical protein